jgi:uncharacterized membrane protein
MRSLSLSAHRGGRFDLSSHIAGHVVLGLLILLVILGIVALASQKYRRVCLLAGAWIVGTIVGVYLVIRGILEFFFIHYNDPASYHNSWGGPSLVGVFLVHSGPGFLVLVGVAVYLWRRARARRSADPARSQRQATPSRR